jgi:hypothetical protein
MPFDRITALLHLRPLPCPLSVGDKIACMATEKERKKLMEDIAASASKPKDLSEELRRSLDEPARDVGRNLPTIEDRIYRELSDIHRVLKTIQEDMAEIKRVQLESRTTKVPPASR